MLSLSGCKCHGRKRERERELCSMHNTRNNGNEEERNMGYANGKGRGSREAWRSRQTQWKDARRESDEGEREKEREKEESRVFFSLKLKAEATYAGSRIYHVVVNNNPSSARTPKITRATVCYFFLPLDARPSRCWVPSVQTYGARDAPFDRCFRGSVLFNSCLIVSRQTNLTSPFFFFLFLFFFFFFYLSTDVRLVRTND